MTARRRVRVADSFFDQLDEALPAERSADGIPSRLDFLLVEMPAVIEEFATGWDDLLWVDPMIDGERVLIRRGLIVRVFAVQGSRRVDDTIDLVGLVLE